jgi:antitoxin VapB
MIYIAPVQISPLSKENLMQTAKLFVNGRSQAVRLPKEYRFTGDDVYIKGYQGMVMLLAKDSPWSSLVDSLDQFTGDFMDERNQPKEQQRDLL